VSAYCESVLLTHRPARFFFRRCPHQISSVRKDIKGGAPLLSDIQGPVMNVVTPIRRYADPPTRFPSDPSLPVRASRRLASSMVAMVVAESLIPYGRISRPP
jgi:hypothetical protein